VVATALALPSMPRASQLALATFPRLVPSFSVIHGLLYLSVLSFDRAVRTCRGRTRTLTDGGGSCSRWRIRARFDSSPAIIFWFDAGASRAASAPHDGLFFYRYPSVLPLLLAIPAFLCSALTISLYSVKTFFHSYTLCMVFSASGGIPMFHTTCCYAFLSSFGMTLPFGLSVLLLSRFLTLPCWDDVALPSFCGKGRVRVRCYISAMHGCRFMFCVCAQRFQHCAAVCGATPAITAQQRLAFCLTCLLLLRTLRMSLLFSASLHHGQFSTLQTQLAALTAWHRMTYLPLPLIYSFFYSGMFLLRKEDLDLVQPCSCAATLRALVPLLISEEGWKRSSGVESRVDNSIGENNGDGIENNGVMGNSMLLAARRVSRV